MEKPADTHGQGCHSQGANFEQKFHAKEKP